MDVLAILAVIFLLAFMVETLTEAIFSPLFDKIAKLSPYKWALMYVALAVGVLGAWVYHFDLLYILSQYIGGDIPKTPYGITITGLAIGRGANYLHDLVTTFFKKPALPA